MHDLVIRNGMVIDGTGAPAFRADVAIDGDRIVRIGTEVGPGREEIDATGRIVTPGWVDMHTHYDAQVTWDDLISPSSMHGVTTVIMGNCGVGFAPARPDRHDWLIRLMEGVEDIPGSALAEGIAWDWETFPEYLDALDKYPRAIDFATQVPHGALRAYVMGDRGAANEVATPEDIERMSEIVAESLRAGALGFSTSRTLLHKSSDGEPVPGTFASRDELFGIAKALGEVGHGVFECASEHPRVPEEMRWMLDMAEETGQPVIFNLSQFDQAPLLWKQAIALLDEAEARDVPVYAQCAGRAIGILMNWRATAHPFALKPTWQVLSQLPWDQQLARLRDPQVKAAILSEQPLFVGEFEAYITQSYTKMFAMARAVDYEPEASHSVAAIAAREGRSPAEVAYDLLLERDGEAFLYFPLFNYADGNLDLLHAMHSHPRTRMGLSDGGAHVGAICDGGMPTFMLSFWTRDRTRGDTLPLEYMVMRQTSQTASLYGLHDRGVLAPGYKADVNVIDYDKLDVLAPSLLFDLPAGGRRLMQRAVGYDATICSGIVTFRQGEHTGALPGRLVRGPQGEPAEVELAVASK